RRAWASGGRLPRFGMEDDAAAASLRGELDTDVGDAQSVDAPLRPGEIHPAGHARMVRGDRLVGAVPEADGPICFDPRFVACPVEHLHQALLARIERAARLSAQGDTRLASGPGESIETSAIRHATE